MKTFSISRPSWAARPVKRTQLASEARAECRGLVAELAERGLKVDYRAVWNFVHAEKLSFKKTVMASERDRPDVAHRRAQWHKYQDRIEPERLVFIDETCTRTNMTPLRGDEAEAVYFAWALGFMSGLNVGKKTAYKVAPKNLAATTQDEQKRFVREWCETHPLSDYGTGVVELLRAYPK